MIVRVQQIHEGGNDRAQETHDTQKYGSEEADHISVTLRSVSASACAAIPSSASMASSSSSSLAPSFDSASASFPLFPDDADSYF